MTLVESLRKVLGAGGIVAELTFAEPIACDGRTRRELARMSRQAIADALSLPEDSIPRRVAA